ncbi:MAG: SAM-dependent chlorinase/fluorinase [Phycisphaerae bacterium]|nr:SAM-dependent chlorinase/fluorinase [Phycisphaerae bacterium]
MPILTFLSDFGMRDSYVAEMKAAALRIVPRATVIDITHEIAPQDVVAASVILGRAIDAFPRGTIHVAVVDPGVGTDRRILAVQIAGQIVLCPDNGLITWPWRTHLGVKAHAVHWHPRSRHGMTFDGRDRFAPVAAMLCKGQPLSKLARPIDDPLLLDIAPTESNAGTIIHIDHFGNATTNFRADHIPPNATVMIRRRLLGPIRKTYADVPIGQPLALIGSAGLLEIAIRNRSAGHRLRVKVGDPVYFLESEDIAKYAKRPRAPRKK